MIASHSTIQPPGRCIATLHPESRVGLAYFRPRWNEQPCSISPASWQRSGDATRSESSRPRRGFAQQTNPERSILSLSLHCIAIATVMLSPSFFGLETIRSHSVHDIHTASWSNPLAYHLTDQSDRYPTPSEPLSGISGLHAPSYVALNHRAFPILALSLTFDTAAVIPNVGDIMISSHKGAVTWSEV